MLKDALVLPWQAGLQGSCRRGAIAGGDFASHGSTFLSQNGYGALTFTLERRAYEVTPQIYGNLQLIIAICTNLYQILSHYIKLYEMCLDFINFLNARITAFATSF